MKLLSQSSVGIGSVDAYTTPSGRKATVTNFTICNRSGSYSNFRLALVPRGQSIANQHYLYYDTTLEANESFSAIDQIFCEQGDKLVLSSTIGSLSMSIFGNETTLS